MRATTQFDPKGMTWGSALLLPLIILVGTAASLRAAGENVGVTIPSLPAGKTVEIFYTTTVDGGLPLGASTISNQGTITYAGGAGQILTDDPDVGGASDPTTTQAFGSSPASFSTPVKLGNLSFEAPVLGANQSDPSVPHWEALGSSPRTFTAHIPGFSADGNQHLGVEDGEAAAQDLPRACFKPDTVYTLTVAVGHRAGQTNVGNASTYAITNYNSTVFLAIGGFDASTIPAGSFADAPTITFDTASMPGVVGQPIRLWLQAGGGGRSHFDNIRLTATSSGVLADAPLAYYRFDEPPGATQATDSSGNGNHGTYTNGATPSAERVPFASPGNAASFDGIDDFIAIPALGSNLPAVTLEGWFKIDADVSAGCCVSLYSPDNYPTGTTHFNLKPGYNSELGVSGLSNSSGGTLPAAEWFHYAVVYDSNGGSATVEFFVNGTSTVGPIPRAAGPLAQLGAGRIGGWNGSGDRNFTGKIDDLAIYGTALTAQQILGRYESALSDSGTYFGEGVWAVREIYGHPITANSAVNAEAIAADPYAAGGTLIEYQSATINRRDTGGSGFFAEDLPFGVDQQTPNGMINGDDNFFVFEARTLMRIDAEDDYTFGFSSDDGARLRIIGAEFTSSTRLNPSNPLDPAHDGNTLSYPANTGNSQTLGVAHLTPGVYELQFLTWEATGGGYCEVFMARGARTSVDGAFRLIGDTTGQAPLRNSLPQVLAPGFDVTVIYDGANGLDAAITGIDGHWSGTAPGGNVFTATAPTIVYNDPDSGSAAHGRTQIPFPGQVAGTDDNNFAVGAMAQIEILRAGFYTFLVLGDDGTRFRIKNSRGWFASGIASPIENGFRIDGCCSDGMGQVFLEPGTYDIELIWVEIGGGAYVSLFAAAGYQTAFGAAFELLGAPGTIPLPATAPVLTGPQPPANDDFAKAFDLGSPPGFNVDGHNGGATLESAEPGGSTSTVWYQWTAPSAGDFTIDTFGSSFDTVLNVFTGGSVNSLSPIGANDNSGANLQSNLMLTASAGQTYHIRVSGFGGASGAYALNLAPVAVPVIPPNDSFANATDLGSGSAAHVTGNLAGATTEAGETPFGLGRSVWFNYTPSADGYVKLQTSAYFAVGIGLFTGSSVNALTPSGLFSNSGEFYALAGTTYRIAIDALAGVPGDFTLSLSQPPTILTITRTLPLAAIVVTFSSNPQQTYRIDSSTNLLDWTEQLKCESSDGSTTTVSLPGLASQRRLFIRVLRE